MRTELGMGSMFCGLIVGAVSSLFLSADVFAKPDVDTLEQSVVRVVALTAFGGGSGTGFVVNSEGIVITNEHVVGSGAEYQVFPSGSSTGLHAELVREDAHRDLAILRVNGLDAVPANLSVAELKKGDRVWALGFPGGADRIDTALDATLTDGVVSRIFTGSWQRAPGRGFEIIQNSAQINKGNSGGPLFDDCGRVVGVNTEGSGADGIWQDELGEVIDVIAVTGIFFASRISAALHLLQEEGLEHTTVSDQCIASQGSGPLEDEEARQRAEEALTSAERMRQAFEATQEGLLELSKTAKVLGAVLTLVGILGVLLALRRPRERIVRVVENYSRRVAAATHRQREKNALGLALSGIDDNGRPITVLVSGENISQGHGAVVGRHPKVSTVVIHDDRVSRRQIRFTCSDGNYYVEDLNSSNGTCVNKARIKPFVKTSVAPGDVLTIGNLEFVLSRG